MNQSNHYELITRALYWLVENQHAQPSLQDLSDHFGLSVFHLQKTFQDMAGISPKQFLKHLSKEEAMIRLKQGQTVLDTAFELGLSGPGRLHDLLVTTEAVTPGQARQSGHGVHMDYGFGDTPFGDALIAWTPRGIGFLGFCHQYGRQQSLAGLTRQWPGVALTRQPDQADAYLRRVFDNQREKQLRVWLKGSPFQLKVWEALLKIPPSMHCSYGQLARHLAMPRASRAVGSAIGRNPISWLIPCHRVLTSMAKLGGYRWGIETKQAMIGFEAGQIQQREVA